MSELKPCPFCGGEADISDEGTGTEPFRYWVYCPNNACFVEGTAAYATEAEAIEAWNTRADDNDEAVTCFNCGAQIDMLGMFTPLAKSSVLYRHYATYCPACGERLVD